MSNLVIICLTIVLISLLIFIYKIIFTCKHKWNKVETIRVFSDDGDKLPMGNKYVMQCSKCGQIKHYNNY